MPDKKTNVATVVSIKLRDKISRHILSGMKIGFARDFFRKELEAESGEELHTQKRYYRIRTSLYTFCRERNPEKFASLQDRDAWKDSADVQYLSLVLEASCFISAEEKVPLADVVDDAWIIDFAEIKDTLEKYELLKYRRRSSETLLQMLMMDSRSQTGEIVKIEQEILKNIEVTERARGAMKAMARDFEDATLDLMEQWSESQANIENLFRQLHSVALQHEESMPQHVQGIAAISHIDVRLSAESNALAERLKQRIDESSLSIRIMESSMRSDKINQNDSNKKGRPSKSAKSSGEVLTKRGGAKAGGSIHRVGNAAAIGR